MTRSTDRVRFCRPARLPGLELVEVSYQRRAFPVHSHEEYVIGVVTRGRERLSVRGAEQIAAPGDLILVEPNEPHRNEAIDAEGLEYRVFYVPRPMIEQAFGLIRFRDNVLPGRRLGRRWAALHRRMMRGAEDLEIEGHFFALLGEVLEMAGSLDAVARPPKQAKVARARAYLDEHFAEAVSLSDLAAQVDLSPYHLLRSFRDQIGITPGAYQIQLRVLEARRRLREGAAIADTATDLGFADQSHLTRHFQRIMGTSPGRYLQQ
jgi:AraC-like DNA-binding protein/mannose-6-phosphate isomerase-like protein (cupin superfamily)